MFWLLFCWLFETGFYCVALATHSIDHADLKPTEICLPLPPKRCWD